MKTSDKAMLFWGAAAIVEAGALEWLLIRLALKVTRQFPEGFWVWFFPLVLFPVLLVVTLVNFRLLKACAQRSLLLRYLAGYLPWTVAPVAATVYGGMWFQTGLWIISALFQIWLPFRFSKKMRLVQKQEREPLAA